ncbi:tyrosine-type recombinase/integrase [Vogesella sp. LIG4]|uniref:tyrosine-type recombinase/integrase n=1 Tax=Vogesella sp. LIG4 TaxID=1192162 RepID=UPI0018D4D3AE
MRPLKLIVKDDGRPLTKGGLRGRFEDARRDAALKFPQLAAEIAAFQFRDLRAKAGTDKADASGDIRQAQKQLGHSSVTMTEQYIRNRRGAKVGPTK